MLDRGPESKCLRPTGRIENVGLLLSNAAFPKKRSIVPSETVRLKKILTRHFVPGYFQMSLTGRCK
jgi:hypothetical protein